MTDQPSSPVRAEILDTGDERVVSAQIEIDAPAEVIFDILIQPRRHSEIDASSSVQSVIEGPERLGLGDTFKVRMKIRIRYWVTNTVLEFEPNRRITWAHLLGNRWTYELTPLTNGAAPLRLDRHAGVYSGRLQTGTAVLNSVKDRKERIVTYRLPSSR